MKPFEDMGPDSSPDVMAVGSVGMLYPSNSTHLVCADPQTGAVKSVCCQLFMRNLQPISVQHSFPFHDSPILWRTFKWTCACVCVCACVCARARRPPNTRHVVDMRHPSGLPVVNSKGVYASMPPCRRANYAPRSLA